MVSSTSCSTNHINSLNTQTNLNIVLPNIITNLTCDKLIMKMVRILFIHRFVHLTHKYHALKTRLTTNKCVDEWSTNLWMNECHTNFVSSNKYVCQMCFQCTISMHKTYKLWISEFCMIIIIKSWNRKFMMMFLKIYLIWVQYKHKRYISNHLINISYKWWKSKARCCQERSINILSFKFKPYLIQCINGLFSL